MNGPTAGRKEGTDWTLVGFHLSARVEWNRTGWSETEQNADIEFGERSGPSDQVGQETEPTIP